MYYVTGAVAKSPSSSRGAACMYIRIGVSDGAQGMRRGAQERRRARMDERKARSACESML